MDDGVKKYLKKLGGELMHGRTYLYATHRGTGDKYRFSFSHQQRKELKIVRNFLRYKGLSVKTWRPSNGK